MDENKSIVFYYACIVFINSYKVKTQITLSKKKNSMTVSEPYKFFWRYSLQ